MATVVVVDVVVAVVAMLVDFVLVDVGYCYCCNQHLIFKKTRNQK